MIIIVKRSASEEQVEDLRNELESQGLGTAFAWGENAGVLGVLGDSFRLDADRIRCLDFVESVTRVTEPYRRAGRRQHPADSAISVGGATLGAGAFALIAGPCTVESREQLFTVAESVKSAGAAILRGGAFKPRTSPYDFQGLRLEGLRLLREVKAACGLPVVSEIMSPELLPHYEDVDMLQVGARNMQNYELLRELGRCGKPVLLKRAPAASVRELLLAAEYVMAGGNEQIVLCERGVRGFESETRNTLDLSAVPVLHEKSHLPVIVDPSHATGRAAYVRAMALAAVAAGADGLMVEVHNDPQRALCDGPQALTPGQFQSLSRAVERVRQAIVED